MHPTLLLEPTVKLQVAPDVQFRLALLPAVIAQLLLALQVPLHEFPQVPLQEPVVQATEQLATPGSQPMVLELPPQAAIAANAIAIRMDFTGSSPLLATHHLHSKMRVRDKADPLPRTTFHAFANR